MYYTEVEIKMLKEVIGKTFSNNFAPTLRSKLVGIYPEKGYCTYVDVKSEYEFNSHIEPRKGVKRMSIDIMWNRFFY